MAPLRRESTLSTGIPRRVSAQTPALRRAPAAETPLGQIQPVFEGFSLAENSVWMDGTAPSQSGPSRRRDVSPPSRPSAPSYPSGPSYPSSYPTMPSLPSLGSPLIKDDVFTGRGEGPLRRMGPISRLPPPPPSPPPAASAPRDAEDRPSTSDAPRATFNRRPRPLRNDGMARSLSSRRKELDALPQPGTARGSRAIETMAVSQAPTPQATVGPRSTREKRPRAEDDEQPEKRSLRRRELSPLPATDSPAATTQAPGKNKPAEGHDAAGLDASHARANKSIALEKIRQPGKRVTIALGSGGKVLTRAERVESGYEALKELRLSLEDHDGPARLPRDSNLANLDIAPIRPSSSTPGPRRVTSSSAALFISDEPTIAYPDNISRSWIEPTSPRVWASPVLPDDTVEGNAEDWSVSTAKQPSSPLDRPSSQATVRASSSSPQSAQPTAKGASPSPSGEVGPSTDKEELVQEEPVQEAESSYIAATSMIFNFVSSLWPSSRRTSASTSAPPPPEMVEVKNDDMVTIRRRTPKKAAPRKIVTSKPYDRPQDTVPRTAAPRPRGPAQSRPSVNAAARQERPRTTAPSRGPSAAVKSAPKPRVLAAQSRSERATASRPAPAPRAPHGAPSAAPVAITLPRGVPTSRPQGSPRSRPSSRSVPSTRTAGSSGAATRAPLGPTTSVSHPNVPRYAQPTKSSFVDAALARLPKPGHPHGSTLPVKVRDAERARDMEIKRALFDRIGEPVFPSDPTLPPRQRRPTTTTVTGTTPGRASRARAAARAQFDAEVARRKAEREAHEAEVARVRAEIEADLDRQNRKATVIRANPLPPMYNRKL